MRIAHRSGWVVLFSTVLCMLVLPVIFTISDRDAGTNKLDLDKHVELDTSADHGVITITGDAELAAFPDKSGAGIEGNPYIIEGLNINGPGTSPSHSMKISNTTAWLVIKDCILSNNNESVVNYQSDNVAIRIAYCSNINITGNSIHQCATAISMYSSNNCVVTGNDLLADDGAGVALNSCNDSLISGNQMPSWGSGVYLSFCKRIMVLNNNMSINLQSIYAMNSSSVVIRDNVVRGAFECISLESSTNNTISGNHLSQFNWYGITLAHTTNTTVVRNFVWVLNIDNTGSTYSRRVVYMYGSSGNVISCNAFWGKADGESGNQWDNGTHGNFWGEYYYRYRGQASNDGVFWDKPYQVGSVTPGENTYDYHPLVYLPDYALPLIYSPVSLEFICGALGQEVVWMPLNDVPVSTMDEFTHSYTIYKDGSILRTGVWHSLEEIVVDLGGSVAGVYNYTIVVNDGTGGVARDMVIVAIRAGILGMEYSTFSGMLVIIASIVCVLIIISVRVRARSNRRVKETKYTRKHESERSRIEKLSMIAKTSSSITISRMAELLDVDEAFVWKNIVGWANQFGFMIQKDTVIFENGKIEAFVEDLDKSFSEWEKNTRDKLGKT